MTNSTPLTGLTSREASAKLSTFGKNELPEDKSRSPFKILLQILREPMIALLVIGVIIYFILGERNEAIFLFFMVGFVASITYFQESRTEKALKALRQLANPKVRVIRNGVQETVLSNTIVPGDIVIISEGDRVPAEGVVLEANSLEINESSITGESLPAIKTSTTTKNKDNITDPTNVFGGTLVVKGSGIIRIEQTGQNTTIGTIGKSLVTLGEQPTRLQKETKKLVQIIGGIALVVLVIFSVWTYLSTHSLLTSLLSSIAVAMSILPEELPVVLTIFLSLGAVKIAKKKVLARNIPSIETLGSATVICTDKTGTLTQNRMSVERIISFNQKNDLDIRRVIRFAVLSSTPQKPDMMEKAIIDYTPQEKIPASYHLLKHYPISSHLPMVGNAWENENKTEIYVKGGVEAVVYQAELDDHAKQTIIKVAEELSSLGMRVIAVGTVSSPHAPKTLTHQKIKVEGLIGLSDPIREEAASSIKHCKQAGIRVIMITGDHPTTAAYIASKVGILGKSVLTGQEIDVLSRRDLARQLQNTNICARIRPEQKLQIVQALQQNGEIVAMIGDGVNDAPALKAANMGIAMGLRGTDVAREASDLILLDDQFPSIINAIAEGRRIFLNIRKAMGFIVAVHLPIITLAVAPILFGWPAIITPIHIVLLELIIDPACTIIFEQEPAPKKLMTSPPRSPKEKILDAVMTLTSITYGITIALILLASNIYLRSIMITLEMQRTINLYILLILIALLVESISNIGLKPTEILRSLRLPHLIMLLLVGGLLLALNLIPFLRQTLQLSALNTQYYLIIFISIGVYLTISFGIHLLSQLRETLET